MSLAYQTWPKQRLWHFMRKLSVTFSMPVNVVKRIAYLYPDATAPDVIAHYLRDFASLIEIARQHNIHVTAIKLPTLTLFHNQLPNETAFDLASTQVLTDHAVPLRDFSAALDDPRFYFDTDHLNRAGVTELFQRRLKPLLTMLSTE
jgi:hypothetical protein